MILKEWWGYYARICEDFSFDPSNDYISSLELSGRLGPSQLIFLRNLVSGRHVTVVGAAWQGKRLTPHHGGGTAIVADSAIEVYMESGMCPDIIVSDMDGNMRLIGECAEQGAIAVIHAHGDNIDMVRGQDFSHFSRIVGTTQNIPLWNLHNFGGFTDGDRAAFMADELGASGITLAGFDFRRPADKDGKDPETKYRKLQWARFLLEKLAEKRGKRFKEGAIIEL